MTTKRSRSLYIPAHKLYVDPEDLAKDWQRNPEERQRHLVGLYGEDGKLFSLEKAGAISVIDRHNGKYAIKDGAGRHWAVMNLLKKPDQELLCVVMEKTEDLEAFCALNAGIHVSAGKKFMAIGADPENKYEHKVCTLLKEFNLTTAPGAGNRTVKINPIIFANDLKMLRRVLTLATNYWGQNKKRRIEGIGIAGLTGFLFIYGDEMDEKRLRHVLNSVDYNELKRTARNFLPKNKEHQRQWGAAMAKELIVRYNAGLKGKTERLNLDKIAMLQERVEDHKHYDIFRQVWEMRKTL